MALIAKSEAFIILCAQRNIFVFNTKDQTHSIVQVPQIPRKKTESSGGVDEKSESQDKNENNDGNADEEPTNEHGKVEFGDINRLAVSPCNRLVAVTTVGDKFLFLYQFDSGTLNLLHSYQLARATSAIRFTPDSKHLLVADKTGDCYIHNCQPNQLNNEAKWILGHFSIVLDVLMTNNSKFIITSDRDEKIRITNYPQTEVIESYCLGHMEFVSAIAELKTQSDDNLLVSISGDKTLRLWNYLDGTELFRLELPARGLRMTQNSKNEFAIALFDDTFKLGIFELKSSENGTKVNSICEHTLSENVKYISSLIYETDDLIWFSGLDESDDVILKRLEISRTNGEISINETNLDSLLNTLKENLSSAKLQPCEDITQLFKKSFDNLTDYQERKKRRILKKHAKYYNIAE